MILMNSLSKTLLYTYTKDSHCFTDFHHYGMVQRYSSVLPFVSKMYILPLALLQWTASNIIHHPV